MNIHITINKIYIEIMPSSTPHQKFSFYHLPTRGRAGIKLGDAWYVSNVSIIYDCSMLYYLLFWTILGFIFHFYIIFGTNLLTGGPTQNCCFFFAYFSVSKKRNIKWSRNGTKSTREVIFGRKATGWTWTPRQEPREVLTRVGGTPPCLVGPLLLHRPTPSSYIYLRTPVRSETEPKT